MARLLRWFRKSAGYRSQTASSKSSAPQDGPPREDLSTETEPTKQQAPATTSQNTNEVLQPETQGPSSSSLAATTSSYLISSKRDTDPSVFYEYVKFITGEAEKREDRYPDIPWQSATVDLTPEQAKDAEEQPFMEFVALITEPEEEP